MKTTLEHMTTLLHRLYEIDVSRYDVSFLNRSLERRMAETQCNTPGQYCTFLTLHPEEAKSFSDSLRISYSEFFRNPLTFAVLERILLPAFVLKIESTKRKEIRVWSAACAAGQEVYSVAMLLEELKIGSHENMSYRIFATDGDESQLKEARQGRYAAAAFQNLSVKRLKKWFANHGELYSVTQELKEHIEYSVFDLLNEQLSSPPGSIFGDFDLVFCANLLFYYKNEYREIILEKAGSALAQGGYLVAGEAEREILMHHGYHEAYPQSAIFQR